MGVLLTENRQVGESGGGALFQTAIYLRAH